MEAELPEDVLEEILLRLPIESLVKFRTVSKQWLRLIISNRFAFKQHQVRTFDDPTSSSYFVVHNVMARMNNKYFITPVSVGGADDVGFNPKIDLPHAAKTVSWPIRCMPAGFGIYLLFERSQGTVFLWNPTTLETKVLPPSPYYLTTFNGAYNYNFGTVDYKDCVINIIIKWMPNDQPSYDNVFPICLMRSFHGALV